MAWTEITRAKYRRDGLRYASDTTDAEWDVIELHLPAAPRRGRTRETDLRDVVDAIFYIAQSGCQWRLLPKDFPPFTTVQRYFYAWRDNGAWQSINRQTLNDVSSRKTGPLQKWTQSGVGRPVVPDSGAFEAGELDDHRSIAGALAFERHDRAATSSQGAERRSDPGRPRQSKTVRAALDRHAASGSR